MTSNLLWISLIFTLLRSTDQQSTIDSKTYIAAVVNYHPITNGNDGQSVAYENAAYYHSVVQIASERKADIIVFPEFGLTSLPKDKKFNESEYRVFYRDVASYIPSPDESTIPCIDHSKANYKKSLWSISCAARYNKIYVVVNHHERVDCPDANCSSDGFLLFNSNVVFDREGRVIARYRKYNLFNEPGTNVTAKPEYSTFTTEFGVTFGTFICFDIIQEKPANYFVKNPNVTDIVYSTHWYDELPFNDAVQQQAAWAYGADVNLLASAYSDALTNSGGSGIYAGKEGPIKVYHPRVTSNALIFAEIAKFNRGKRGIGLTLQDPYIMLLKDDRVARIQKETDIDQINPSAYQDDLRPYSTILLNPRKSYTTTLCDRGLCCDFELKTKHNQEFVKVNRGSKYYSYRLVVFNGVRQVLNVKTAGIQVCALVACAGNRIEDCGKMFSPNVDVILPTHFLSLMITRRANLTSRVFYEPSTLTLKDRLPLVGEQFSYIVSKHNESSLLLMHLLKETFDLMTFGIYGRNFDRDGEEPNKFQAVHSEL